ncbi:hypothetical protein TL16_g05171 [Triparma laevis f. inornata]|uniref:TPM domain-containing protein n=1 Tax=Triparma laevis f. inornata TaxID=1714386 RepID=A0A9W7EAZ9_9STRA|nr:hypothetical protein TL16_g05171 [Triparma laevis f. inornata]
MKLSATLTFILLLLSSSVSARLSSRAHRDFAKSYVSTHDLCDGLWDGRLCDPFSLLQNNNGATLSKLQSSNLKKVTICDDQQQTLNPDQIEIAIVLLPSMTHVPYSSLPEPNSEEEDRFVYSAAKALAEELHDHYGVGDPRPPSCAHHITRPDSDSSSSTFDTGILILVSRDDRVMHISTGGGVDDFFALGRIDKIISAAKPHFRKQRLSEGLIASLEVLDEFLEMGPPSSSDRFWNNVWTFGPFFSIFGFCIFLLVRSHKKSKQYNAAKEELNKLEREKAEALAGKYRCKSCPICLEDFKHCPICRADINMGTPADTSTPTSNPTPNNNPFHRRHRTHARFYEDSYEPELRFRLNRLRRRYPRYISSDYVDRYSSRNSAHFAMDPVFMRANPNPHLDTTCLPDLIENIDNVSRVDKMDLSAVSLFADLWLLDTYTDKAEHKDTKIHEVLNNLDGTRGLQYNRSVALPGGFSDRLFKEHVLETGKATIAAITGSSNIKVVPSGDPLVTIKITHIEDDKLVTGLMESVVDGEMEETFEYLKTSREVAAFFWNFGSRANMEISGDAERTFKEDEEGAGGFKKLVKRRQPMSSSHGGHHRDRSFESEMVARVEEGSEVRNEMRDVVVMGGKAQGGRRKSLMGGLGLSLGLVNRKKNDKVTPFGSMRAG